VIYHSATGNTEKMAKQIASELNCDLLKINNNDNPNQGKLSTITKIVKQIIQRNQFKADLKKIDLTAYSRIYIGSPCWFYTYIPPIEQFLKTTDYHNKEIIFFLTHGGGPRKTIESLK
jgi:flavodoxin